MDGAQVGAAAGDRNDRDAAHRLRQIDGIGDGEFAFVPSLESGSFVALAGPEWCESQKQLHASVSDPSVEFSNGRPRRSSFGR